MLRFNWCNQQYIHKSMLKKLCEVVDSVDLFENRGQLPVLWILLYSVVSDSTVTITYVISLSYIVLFLLYIIVYCSC